VIWGAPERLWWLSILAPAVWLMVHLIRRKQRAVAQITDPAGSDRLLIQPIRCRLATRQVLWIAAMTLILAALARPQWGETMEEVRRRGLDIVVALDTSKSMLAEDLKPNRLQQAKWGIRDLAARLKGDRVGLVAFAGTSFLQCPLTIDYSAFMLSLDDVYVGIIPRGGTAIADALNTAAKSFDDTSNADRVILLITDGEDHEGDLDRKRRELKEQDIRVFVVGVGSSEGELIPVPPKQGESGFLKDRQGNVVKSSLQESTLQQLALDTGGLYVRAVPGDFGVEPIVERGLAVLKRDESEARQRKTHHDRFGWFLGTAGVLLALEAAFVPRRRIAHA
jgi:Ca-activated chloride channel family protein